MEGLRHSLLAPSGATVLMLFGTFDAMKKMIMVRYASVDDNGKPLFPHPYEPWQTVDPKYKEQAGKAYRAFKMFENVKEWTLMSLPLMWVFSIYGGGVPHVTDSIMDGLIMTSSGLYMLGNHWYVEGYISAPKNRLTGFKVRRRVVEFWLFGSFLSVVWGGLSRFGIVG